MEPECRTLPDYDGYRFGSDGSVWSCWVKRGLASGKGGTVSFKSNTWHQLSGSVNRDGYLRVRIKRTGKGKVVALVHQLILFAFVGPRPVVGGRRLEACHNNGNPVDNRACNLRWDTQSENQKDATRHGRKPVGKDAPCREYSRKLNESQVLAIRSRLEAGETGRSLAKEFGVCFQLISVIKNRKTWVWL